MMLLDFFLVLYAILSLFLFLLYMPRLRCWFYARHRQPRLHEQVQHTLALLIPARNESATIRALLDSLQTQTYPRERFDAHVIVADAADPTIEMARAAGASVHVVPHQTCKGDALDACLKTILTHTPQRYDAYIIVDADCVLDARFCEEMNNAMASGADIICAKKKVKNYFFGTRREQPLSACCNGLIWTLIDNMGNAAKAKHGDTCFTVGTGLLLRNTVVRQNGGWPYRATVTEDMELMHDTLLKGWKTFYYSYAVLYMEEACSLRVTNKRRRRWMTGVIDSKRRYAPLIAADPVASRNHRQIYHTRNLWVAYALIGLSALFCLGNAAACALLLAESPAFWLPALRNALIGFGAIYVMFFVMTLFALIADWENIRLPLHRKLILLFVHPFFYMQYIPIVAMGLFTGFGRQWDAIERVHFTKSKEH